MLVETERDIDSGGWIGPKEVVWSLTFPDGQAPPPSIVARIRKTLPGYVPMFCTRVFVGPDGQKQEFRYHVIGIWRQAPDPDCPDFHRILKNIVRPFDFPFKGGVIYEQYAISAPWPDGSWQKARMTPDIPLCCVSGRSEDQIAREKHRCLSESIPQRCDMDGHFIVEGYERITQPPIEMHWERTCDWIEKSVKFTKLIGDTYFERLEGLRRKRHELRDAETKKIDSDADYRIKTDGLYKRAVQNGWFVPLPRDITPWAPTPFVHLRK